MEDLPARPDRIARASFTLVAGTLLLAGPSSLGAQWPAGTGSGWAKITVMHHSTTERYGPTGLKQRFFSADAESRSTALFLDALVGVTSTTDLWLQVPYFDLAFDDVGGDRTASGIGDVRISVRQNLLQLRGGSVPISVRVAAKWPILDSPIDAEIIPVGEGQWDFEAWLEGGVSFWPLPAYGVLWLGYRWRTENTDLEREPGDERMLLAELGATVWGRLGAKLIVDGLFGTDGRAEGIAVSRDAREILILQPGLTWGLRGSDTVIEAGVRVPVRGQNFPAGPQFAIALFHRWSGS